MTQQLMHHTHSHIYTTTHTTTHIRARKLSHTKFNIRQTTSKRARGKYQSKGDKESAALERSVAKAQIGA